MKKVIALLLAVAVLFTLAACAKSENGGDPTPSDVPETEAPTEDPSLAYRIENDRSVEFMTFVPPEGYTSIERILDMHADGTLSEKTLNFYWDDGSEVSYASTSNYRLEDYLDVSTLESKEINGQTAYFYNESSDHMVMFQIGDVLCALDCVPAEGSEDYSRLDEALENLQFGECEFACEADEDLGAIRCDLSVLGEPVSTSSSERVDLEGNTLRKSFTWRYGQDADNLDYRMLIRVVYGGKVEDELSEYSTYEDGTLLGLPCKIRMEDGHQIEYFVQRGDDVYVLKNMGVNGGWFVDRSEESYSAFDALIETVSFEGVVSVGAGPALTLTEQPWTGWSPEQPEPTVTVFSDLAADTVIYDSVLFGRIEVAQVTDEKIELRIAFSLFVEPNEDGTVNLSAAHLDSITIHRGEEKKLASTTMDGGTTLTIKYEQHGVCQIIAFAFVRLAEKRQRRVCPPLPFLFRAYSASFVTGLPQTIFRLPLRVRMSSRNALVSCASRSTTL